MGSFFSYSCASRDFCFLFLSHLPYSLLKLSLSYDQEATCFCNCCYPCLCLSGSDVYAAVGQCHFLVNGTSDKRDDNRSSYTCCDFTSEVSAGNEDAVYIGTTGIFSCEFSKRDGLFH